MIQDALQTQAEAEGKLQRAKLSFGTTADIQRGSAAMVGLRKLYEAANGNDFQLNGVSRPCRCRRRFADEAIRCERELSSLSMYCPSGQENGLLRQDNLLYTKTGHRTNSSPFIILLFSAYRSVRPTSVVLANSPSSS